MLTYAVGRFRLVSLLEGCSFLVLLFIAMPLKYMGHCRFPSRLSAACTELCLSCTWSRCFKPGCPRAGR